MSPCLRTPLKLPPCDQRMLKQPEPWWSLQQGESLASGADHAAAGAAPPRHSGDIQVLRCPCDSWRPGGSSTEEWRAPRNTHEDAPPSPAPSARASPGVGGQALEWDHCSHCGGGCWRRWCSTRVSTTLPKYQVKRPQPPQHQAHLGADRLHQSFPSTMTLSKAGDIPGAAHEMEDHCQQPCTPPVVLIPPTQTKSFQVCRDLGGTGSS